MIIIKDKFKVLPVSLLLLCATIISAHPGSGIVVDPYGQVYFTGTGKGVWKLGTNGELVFLPASRFHWLAIDNQGSFAAAPKNFGSYFERVTPTGVKPTLVLCSDFPLVTGKDGNIYYADTRHHAPKIMKRTPAGSETVLDANHDYEFISGMAAGADGFLYITEASNPQANTIRKISANGSECILARYAVASAKNVPLEATPSYCRGLAVDAGGNVYVAATGNRRIIKISPGGKITTVMETPVPWSPTGVAVFEDEIYVLEWQDVPAEKLETRTAFVPRIRKLARNGSVTTLATVTR